MSFYNIYTSQLINLYDYYIQIAKIELFMIQASGQIYYKHILLIFRRSPKNRPSEWPGVAFPNDV